MVLQVLNVFYVLANANNAVRDSSNENRQKYFNDQDYMRISIISHNIQMWACVQYQLDYNNVIMSSMQIFNNMCLHKSIRAIRNMSIINQIQSKENVHIKMSTMNISPDTSGISLILHSVTYKSTLHRYITVIERSNEKKNVFTSVIVTVMTNTQLLNGTYKLFGQTVVDRAFDKLFVTNCYITTLARTQNVASSNIYSTSNSVFPMYRAMIKKN
ncbi:hypothetical protein RFI_06045 [Reticulomyxa filosa]|uniref:Uncharacterized protein n=1 Tax=Reticulomyxa filosa TaxID=46433 RepID=X6NXP0_RETFI|nr:hypothetical protein RFI_06045 [Reticulomyxa filosa]|eukprot:ETO31075.1 hypothetical protein RFI_06045 [Reticulomyxa filosa]